MKKVLLLGASGSIGTQTLDILDKYPNDLELVAFSVGKRTENVERVIRKYSSIKWAYVINKDEAIKFQFKYPNITFYFGKNGLRKLVKRAKYDICVDALVGFVGMEPAILSLKRKKILCLANKEALVSGGTIINKLLSKGKGKLYPIDSEHVALAKCLSKTKPENVKQLVITASGGALRNVDLKDLSKCKARDALRHPTWKMGNKITIDCATMMNKGFEVIEAYYLFGYGIDKIKIQMHDESLIHSAVLLNDGTYLVDYGKPDMHNPIEYALTEGKCNFEIREVKSFEEFKGCHFREYDPNRYPLTELAKKCLSLGASKMIALNAANEVAVNRYLNDEIGYLDIYRIVNDVVSKTRLVKNPCLSMVKHIDKISRKEARK